MKRIGTSIAIGLFCSLLFFAATRFLTKRIYDNRLNGEKLLELNAKLKIGEQNDDENTVINTFNIIKKRAEIYYGNFRANTITKNEFAIHVRNVEDSLIAKKILTGSGKLEFMEVFTLGDLAEQFSAANKKSSELSVEKGVLEKKQETEDKKDTIAELLEPQADKLNPSLIDLIKFSHPYAVNSIQRFPASIGYLRKKDTMRVNNILRHSNIISIFPPEISFVYGTFDEMSYEKDSFLTLYAVKIIDEENNPFPTGDQVVFAETSFETQTNLPTINFAFNAEGSKAWYEMTRRNVGKPIAIIMNGFVLSAPIVESPIEGGNSTISGSFTKEECNYLTKLIISGRLPLAVETLEYKFISQPRKKSGTLLIPAFIFFISGVLTYIVYGLIKPAPRA